MLEWGCRRRYRTCVGWFGDRETDAGRANKNRTKEDDVKADGIQISEHLLKVWELLNDSRQWLTSKEVAQITGISDRTARHHVKFLADAKLIEVNHAFGGYLYRMNGNLKGRDVNLDRQLRELSVVRANREGF